MKENGGETKDKEGKLKNKGRVESDLERFTLRKKKGSWMIRERLKKNGRDGGLRGEMWAV